jgi:hypothetical protein
MMIHLGAFKAKPVIPAEKRDRFHHVAEETDLSSNSPGEGYHLKKMSRL